MAVASPLLFGCWRREPFTNLAVLGSFSSGRNPTDSNFNQTGFTSVGDVHIHNLLLTQGCQSLPRNMRLEQLYLLLLLCDFEKFKKINVQNTDVKKRGVEVRCCHFDHQNEIFNPSVSCPLLPRRFWISWFLGLPRSTRLARRAHCTNPSLCVRNAMQRDLYLCALFTARVLIRYLSVESIALCGKRALKNEPQHTFFFLNLRSKNKNRL